MRSSFLSTVLASAVLICPAFAAPKDAPDAAKPAAKDSKSEDTTGYTGPKRAGGGPINPEIHFPLPPPRVLTPQEEIKTFKLPQGFHAELVASEPMIESPIAVSWDDQGRMYVVEMRGYMHDVDATGEDQPTCRISRLESTKGDGIYDKATVFVDNLVLPRTVMALGDGAVVSVPPNLFWYHDKKGAGMADGQDLISAHYATADGQPEHMANSATWMMDNWISSANYGSEFRLQPGGTFLTRPTVPFGQWGNTQDDWGRQFTNSNSDLLRAHLVPPSYYLRNPHLTNQSGLSVQVMKDQTTWPSVPTPGVNRGYMEDTMQDGKLVKGGTLRMDGTLESVTATCGPAVYRGDLFPPEYRGNVFIPEPAANLVKRVILSEKDGVITAANAYEGKEFLTSTDERFRPVNAYTGPDGALYIVDIARGVIQHKGFLTYYLVKNIFDRKLESPFNLGRIYRIVPDGAKPKLVQLPKETARIPAMLTHANGWVRDNAQRVLVERQDAAVVPEVKKLAATGATPQTRVQALWTLEGLNALTPEVIRAALHDKDEKVRAAGVRLADPAMAADLAKLGADPSGEVRMHLAFKLSGSADPAAAKTLLALLDGSSPIFGEAAASGQSEHELEYLETLLKLPASADSKLDKSTVLGILAGCVMKERKAPNVSRLIDLIAAQPAGSARQLALLNGMAGKAPSKKSKYVPRPLKLAAAPAGLATLQASKDGKVKSVFARIDPQIVWSGKPGWVEPVIVPLTAQQQALYEQGKTIYSTICTACHQPNGAGMAGLAPPLVDSEWVLGQPDKIIRIVTQGLSGPVEVKGNKWELEMPGLPIFTDEQIAGLLTYIRREWEHTGSPVAPDYVTKVRAAIKDHVKPWSATELNKSVDVKSASAK